MKKIEDFLGNKLAQRLQKQNLRSLRLSKGLIDFTSNDYLGLSRSEELKKLIEAEYRSANEITIGATGSRLLSGNSFYFQQLEKFFSSIFLSENTLVFNSGYSANLAVLSSIPGKGDTIICDELVHACIKDGARLSLAQKFTFKHNDLRSLESKLLKASGNTFVVIESIYSMDGDFSPLAEIVSLCKKYGAAIILDEAHSTGVTGNMGNGMACLLNLQEDIFARIYTFGKAMGIHGACVAGSATLINYLINFSRQFIYTTALPNHTLLSIKNAFQYLQDNMYLQEVLGQKIAFFKETAKSLKLENFINSQSSIQALIVPGNQAAKELSANLQNEGFDVRPILSPTVKEGTERIRICLHVHNNEDEIRNLLIALSKYLHNHHKS